MQRAPLLLFIPAAEAPPCTPPLNLSSNLFLTPRSSTVPSRSFEARGREGGVSGHEGDASASDWMKSDSEEDAAPQAAVTGGAAAAPAVVQVAEQLKHVASPASLQPPAAPAVTAAATTTSSSSSSSSSAAATAAAQAEAAALASELSELKVEHSKVKLLLSRERLRATSFEKGRGEVEQELGLLRAELVKLKSCSAAMPSRDSAEVAKANKAKEQYRKEAESLRRQVARRFVRCIFVTVCSWTPSTPKNFWRWESARGRRRRIWRRRKRK